VRYRRNAPAVHAALAENKDNQVIAKEPCRIQAPVRFFEVNLGQIGIITSIYGFFALILETGEYAVMNANAIMEINPYKQTIVTIDDIDYYEFYFDKGDVVIKTTELVKRETLLFNVFDEEIFKGKVPWYAEYEDMGKIFDSAQYHAGSRVADTPEVIEALASIICRDAKDRSMQIRLKAQTYDDVSAEKISFVALKSIYYSVDSTVNKLAGSYFTEGLVSALVNPSNRVEKVESILRA
jgi:hypothetical protein